MKAETNVYGAVNSLRMQSTATYLDVKLQVFIHGIDMVEDVMCDPWYNAHELRVMKLSLVNK